MAKSTRFARRKKSVARSKPIQRSVSLLFVLLLGKNLTSVFFAPLRGSVKVLLIGISLWLGLGALSFGLSYYGHARALETVVLKQQALEKDLAAWQKVLVDHPTSREALLGAYAGSLSLGKDEDAKRYLETLKRIDPNDPRVKELSETSD